MSRGVLNAENHPPSKDVEISKESVFEECANSYLPALQGSGYPVPLLLKKRRKESRNVLFLKR